MNNLNQKKTKNNRLYIELNNEVVALQCTSCKFIKIKEDFHKTKKHFAGISTICKKCNNEKVKEFYRKKRKLEKKNEVEA
ncbi:hypothetical protein [Bacillus paralicheniformis]|uniref:hypothetical protein n=1 Tax=Bacillus paralicheniformis TaxID=1648923 RepID=UPI002DBD1DB3|nr:hypothetical protein [Bacillus paralicheniformis]MEC1866731.1 hypothetical protein [Bacillus paralicheniformis]